jgi:hypothetical protein
MFTTIIIVTYGVAAYFYGIYVGRNEVKRECLINSQLAKRKRGRPRKNLARK